MGFLQDWLLTWRDYAIDGVPSSGRNNPDKAAIRALGSKLDPANAPLFVGDTGTGGTKGLVPAPSAGDAAANKVLGAGGGWVAQSGDGGNARQVDILSPDRATGVPYQTHGESYPVSAGATATLIDYTGDPGYLDTFWFANNNSDINAYNQGLINIYIDGSAIPDISLTACEFFQNLYGFGNPGASNASWANRYFANANALATASTSATKLPIPFSTRIKITWTNAAASQFSLINWNITLQTGVPKTWPKTGRLHISRLYLPTIPMNGAVEYPLVDAVVPGGGRVVGVFALFDGFANQNAPENPINWEMEGNVRFYFDQSTIVWKANTGYTLGQKFIDANGNLQTCTKAGTSGSGSPTFAQGQGQTTTDGSVVWTEKNGDPNFAYSTTSPWSVDWKILDPNGNVQRVVTGGAASYAPPVWNKTIGGTSQGGDVVWVNDGPDYVKANIYATGTEDFFHTAFYGTGLSSTFGQGYDVGIGFVSDNPEKATTVTRSFYRWFNTDPQRFNSSLNIRWQGGNPTNNLAISGTPRVWLFVYWYSDS